MQSMIREYFASKEDEEGSICFIHYAKLFDIFGMLQHKSLFELLEQNSFI